MKFDYIVGNPPYQEDYQGESTGANSIYDHYLEESYKLADKVEMIHPARFLFNAGSTSKQWNQKMLNDTNFKIIHYEPDNRKIFGGKEIKGGIVISYHDKTKTYGPIGTFTPYDELNDILHKVIYHKSFNTISEISITSSAYHFTNKLHEDHPEVVLKMSKGHANDLKSSVFETLSDLSNLFYDEKPIDNFDYLKILGRSNKSRSYKYIRSDYINNVINLYKHKLFLPKADGDGSFGETITNPVVASPGTGATETFYSIGIFDSNLEVNNLLKYIKTKFSRSLLNVLKITQDVNPGKWKYVPLQDFTENSDIDWTKSIHEIDLQLYQKYGLDEKEIDFIETHVKEMS